MCEHVADALALLRTPNAADNLYKDECTQCFDGVDAGLLLCLHCWNGGCCGERAHGRTHAVMANHPLALWMKRTAIVEPKQSADGDVASAAAAAGAAASEPSQKITKLAFGVEGGIPLEDVGGRTTTETRFMCLLCDKEIEDETGMLSEIRDSVLQQNSAAQKSDLEHWQYESQLKPCEHVLCVQQADSRRMFQGGEHVHCDSCDLSSGLWLCLTCGHCGCSRRQYDGSGGNDHALAHAKEHNHWVVVKIGTITPEGKADVHCYNCEEERLDPDLVAHLRFLGLDVAQQVKTEQSTAEIELARSLALDFSSNIDDGKALEPRYGAGFCGLKNLGNSCYMNSVLQVLFHQQPFIERYRSFYTDHAQMCTDDHGQCLECQLGKIAHALVTDAYTHAPPAKPATDDVSSKPEAPETSVAPRMFKQLIARNHREFASTRQQDALEFLQYFVEQLERHEKRQAVLNADKRDPTRALQFELEQRMECTTCHGCRYQTLPARELMLRVPVARATGFADPPVAAPTSAVSAAAGAGQSAPAAQPPAPVPIVPLSACLQDFGDAESVALSCPSCGGNSFHKTTRVARFPQLLVIALSRFVVEGMMYKKLEAVVPPADDLDLAELAGHGPQPSETILPSASAATSSVPPVDQAALAQLLEMGFPKRKCERALRATKNDPTAGTQWLFEHMDDPDDAGDEDVSGAAAGGAPAELVAMITSMGFSERHAERALAATGNDVERAIEWVLSHGEDDAADAGSSAAGAAGAAGPSEQPVGGPGSSRYRLVAAVNHRGTSATGGHYVAHVRVNNEWVLFNDSRVLATPNPALSSAYLLVYGRVE